MSHPALPFPCYSLAVTVICAAAKVLTCWNIGTPNVSPPFGSAKALCGLVVSVRSAPPMLMIGTTVDIFTVPSQVACHQFAVNEPAGAEEGMTTPESDNRGDPGFSTRTLKALPTSAL